MIGNAFQFEDLQKLTGYSRLADVERCLKSQGITFLRGKDGIWTTLEALNVAMGIAAPSKDAAYRPDEVL